MPLRPMPVFGREDEASGRRGNCNRGLVDGIPVRTLQVCEWRRRTAGVGRQIGLGLDLLFEPDKALQPDIAYKIMTSGTVDGIGFAAGKRLQHYLCDGLTNYVGARAIVNGSDQAVPIARPARLFEGALMAIRS